MSGGVPSRQKPRPRCRNQGGVGVQNLDRGPDLLVCSPVGSWSFTGSPASITVGKVPGLDEVLFVEHAYTAKAGCPVSRALAGVPEITLEATLAR